MAIDCRDEIGVKRSCRIVLVGSMALANEVVFASPPVGVIGGTDATGAETGYAIAEVKTVKTKPRENSKKHLAAAKSAKRDEFYTQLSAQVSEVAFQGVVRFANTCWQAHP